VAVPRLLLLLIVTLAAGALLAQSVPSRPARAGAVPGSGDVDCSGTVNAVDAALLLQFDARLVDSVPCADAADAYADGQVDSLDALAILVYNAGFVEALPIPPSPPPNTEPGTVMALDVQTGNAIWSVQPGMAAIQKPVVTSELVLVTGGDNCLETHSALVALDRATGTERWRKRLNSGAGCGSSLTAFADVAVLQDGLFAVGINVSDGSTRWRHQLEPTDNNEGNVVQADAGNVVLLREGSVLRALDRQTGNELWEVDRHQYDLSSTVNSTTAFADTKQPGLLCGVAALDLSDGHERWNVPGVREGCGPFGVDDDLVAACNRSSNAPPIEDQFGNPIGNQVLALDAATGDERWRRNMACTKAEPDGGNVYIQLYNVSERTLTALDATSGAERWHIDSPSAANLLATGGYIFLMPAYDLFAFDADTGATLWNTRLPGGGFYNHAALEGGTLYVAARGHPVEHD